MTNDALTIAVASLKGGVGKTTTTVNLAAIAAIGGLRTLVWDLDAQGSATWALGVDASLKGGTDRIVAHAPRLRKAVVPTQLTGLDVLPSDIALRTLDIELAQRGKPRKQMARSLAAVTGDHDVVWLDCAPGLTLVNEGAIRAADIVLVPIVASPLSVRAFDQLVDFIADSPKLRHARVFGFVSMVDRRKRNHRELAEQLPATNPRVLHTSIPSSAVAEQSPEDRTPLVLRSRAAVVSAYRDLWHEIQDRAFAPPATPVPASPTRRTRSLFKDPASP